MIRILIKLIKLLEKRYPWFARCIKGLRLHELKMWTRFFIRQILLRRLFGQPRAILYDFRDGKILIAPDDLGMAIQLNTQMDREHGALENALLSEVLPKSPDFLCVGTHVGTFAIPMAEHCKKVVAIEANPNTYELLKANISISEKNNIETHNVAAWHTSASLDFLRDDSATVLSRVLPKRAAPDYRPDTGTKITKVPAVNLDELLPGRRFDLLLMDVEGAETNALRGATLIMENIKYFWLSFLPAVLNSNMGASHRLRISPSS